jgi:hypothetical protein
MFDPFNPLVWVAQIPGSESDAGRGFALVRAIRADDAFEAIVELRRSLHLASNERLPIGISLNPAH